MANLTEKDFREYVIAGLSDILTTAKFLKRNPYSQPRNSWIGALSHKVGDEIILHSWFLRRTGLRWQNTDIYETWIFQIMGFRGLEVGSDVANSEDLFQSDIDLLNTKLQDADGTFWSLDTITTDDEITIGLVTFEPIGIIKIGETQFVHSVSGRFEVDIYKC